MMLMSKIWSTYRREGILISSPRSTPLLRNESKLHLDSNPLEIFHFQVRNTAGFKGRRVLKLSKAAKHDPIIMKQVKETLEKAEINSQLAVERAKELPKEKIKREEFKKKVQQERKENKILFEESKKAEKEVKRAKENILKKPKPRLLTFEQTLIHPHLVTAVGEMGWRSPTNIQRKAMPRIMSGEHLVASDKTGTGKTGAYILPSLHQLEMRGVLSPPKTGEIPGPSILIITPTKELADQVAHETQKMAHHMVDVKIISLSSSHSQTTMNKLIHQGVDILISTPGRLATMVSEKEPIITLSGVKTFILDECDRILADGHLTEVVAIWKKLPKYRHTKEVLDMPTRKGMARKIPDEISEKKQVVMFSATLTKEVLDLAKKLIPKAEILDLNSEMSLPDGVNHIAFQVSRRRKQALLFYLIRRGGKTSLKGKQAIIFVRTIQRAERLSERLTEAGFESVSIHSDLSAGKREKIIERFKSKEIKFLIATEVMARGIDIPELPYVVNFDVPTAAQDFIHRVGRTARAGAEGVALTFVSKESQIITLGDKITELNEMNLVQRIERLMGQPLRFGKIPGPWRDGPIEEEETSVEKEEKLKKLRLAELYYRDLRKEGATKKEAAMEVEDKQFDEHSLLDFEEGRYEDVIKEFDTLRAKKSGAIGPEKLAQKKRPKKTYSRKGKKNSLPEFDLD